MITTSPLSSSLSPLSQRQNKSLPKKDSEEKLAENTRKKEIAGPDPDRLKKLEDIKRKVSQGYYSTQAVTNDISDKLGHLLDELT